jgi:[methyl-Co(III) methanol-specific corrinoid protein]:coenzyme M methyltransferase
MKDQITPKERLRLALLKEKVDRPPCICPGGMMNMVVEDVMDITGCSWPEAHSDAKLMAALSAGIYENGGFENFGVPFCMTVEAEAMGAEVFLGTRINEPRVTKYIINSVSDWANLKRINVNEGRAKTVIDAIKILKDRNSEVPIVANLIGPVSLAASLMEPVDFYKEIIKKPMEAHKLMEFVTENLIEFGKAQLAAGADVLAISDPSATGEILGPVSFKRFAVPYLNKIVDALKQYAATGIIIHICGRLKSIYEELNSLNSHAISFDSITSVRQVCENVHNKAIMGNVSTFTLENGSEGNIKDLTLNCLDSGVNILSPACGIGPKTSFGQIKKMVETSKKYKLNSKY